MDGNDVTSDKVIAELVDMGFDILDIAEAIKAVGPSLDNAIELILNSSRRNDRNASTSSMCLTDNKVTGKRASSSLQPSAKLRQRNITEQLKLSSASKRSKMTGVYNASVSARNFLTRGKEPVVPSTVDTGLDHCQETGMVPSYCKDEKIIGLDWERKATNLLQKNFGYSSLKGFQKEALAAWMANQDCLVLAATGSGKSLCFQIPALLSGKVVVVISPLISLMHDQCLKLGKLGISACFLGSGQLDKCVENKAMNGAYSIIYVCPETILRLMKPLQSLAESRGIALFAIDEVHCVSKWGHDFRPDYRRLSILRESFSAENLKCLKSDIPLMALTATATIRVREDILKSLCMSKEMKIVTTSFFRPNLRFSVKHSRTSGSNYEKDFNELIKLYTKEKKALQKLVLNNLDGGSKTSSCSPNGSTSGIDRMCRNMNDSDDSDDDDFLDCPEEELSVQYLEDDCDRVEGVDDLDVFCGESCGPPSLDFRSCGTSDSNNLMSKAGKRPALHQRYLEEGPTIIYVPTRKQTLSLTKFLTNFGVKAAAYNAKLPKSHLRQVHGQFHADELQVVVATIAFGMGIDKSNVRRIIHYGWPQSLEAYYQEAGRAGRDGELADCVLYANLSRIPTLLPSKRSEEQTKQAYQMLSDCFRYGMKSSCCRAKMLVEYFGEEFSTGGCNLCDVCTNGPPEIQDLKEEATLLLRLIATYHENNTCQIELSNDVVAQSSQAMMLRENPNISAFVRMIREQNQKYATSDFTWWRGLARILEERGFIREGDEMDSSLFLMHILEDIFN
ncbi:ATP-dependent DNA helicase Q-like SIM isoform X2 [Salvia miltiorrhiza]|uniref:ATP-dependent DNA helicase Q-like SIM isoform X2 n=1 Tax=Salvia miltiorrhiza TaxID=226208 RepID=UPI0025AD2053|nr:ATP-dependent DNA helicase Q-like SIM isoform X2 [Salvia miltiorrhiza]